MQQLRTVRSLRLQLHTSVVRCHSLQWSNRFRNYVPLPLCAAGPAGFRGRYRNRHLRLSSDTGAADALAYAAPDAASHALADGETHALADARTDARADAAATVQRARRAHGRRHNTRV